MKLIAISDLHGHLPKIKTSCDVICICGDIMPLDIQFEYHEGVKWLTNKFIPWVDSLPCKKVMMVAGNHDIIFDTNKYPTFKIVDLYAIHKLLKSCEKLEYLQDSKYEFDGKVFYGTPWCSGIIMARWAFYSPLDSEMQHIPDCDVLLTHAPSTGEVGTIHQGWQSGVDCGSKTLRTRLEKGGIKYCFSGHIHSGLHENENIGGCICRNVSIKDEDYLVKFRPCVVEI